MTVPTDSLSSHGPSGGKVRHPMPTLASDHPLKGSNPSHPTQRNPRASGKVPSGGAQNSLLSSWLSNAHGSNRIDPSSSSSTAGDQTGTGLDVSHHQIDTKDEPSPREGSEVSSNAELEGMDIDKPHQDPATSIGDKDGDPSPEQPVEDAPTKGKRGRKPKAKPDAGESDTGSMKSKTPKVPKEKTANESKQPKPSKQPKQPKETKQKKTADKNNEDASSPGNPSTAPTSSAAAAAPSNKSDRSILSFFDRSTVSTPKGALGQHVEEQPLEENAVASTNASAKTPFKQSCLQFDKLDPSKADSYFANMAAASVEEDKRFGNLLKELPKLTGRAPYEDLLEGLIMRSSKLPSVSKLDLHRQDLDMDMLADVKMVHEFINTFGSPLGLTKDSGEWITYDALLGMIRNPRVDNRLLDLNCKMITAAYEEGKSPAINYFNFPYFLAVGPATLEDKKEEKKNKLSSVSAKRKIVPQVRLATTEYSVFTVSDRIEALVKALHDITSSDRFHRFMRNEVEENITSLKRHKRKRAEVRKELETQTHDLEREMRTIEYEAAQLETQRQAILTTEREGNNPEEDVAGSRISSSSRLQRLALAKDARNKANDLLNQQKALANDLKIKESAWEIKKEELDNISLDDNELQKEHNIPLSQLRGGQAVNGDEKLRVICLGNDRWGRKYWFWRQFGGIIVEDRKQLGPKIEDTVVDETDTSDETKPKSEESNDATMADVTERMKSMAKPELTGQKTQSTKEIMSINNLLSSNTPPAEESSPFSEPEKPSPPKDLLDYGQAHTWGLISTSKELASLIRALNSKGVREKYLKASLVTMRKEIEASFKQVPSWVGREVVVRREKSTTSSATVGQLLSEHDLIALKKKRGRKSRQEMANIAATEMVLSTGDDRHGMDFDLPTTTESTSGDQDEPMEDGRSDGHEAEESIEEDDSTLATFLRAVRDEESGPTRSEYYSSLVQAAEERLHELSKTICDTEDNVILKAIHASLVHTPESRLDATVRVLQQCLLAMDEPEEKEMTEAVVVETPLATAETTDAAMDVDVVEEMPAEVDGLGRVPCSVPVTVNARLLAWLRACHIETMLKSVRTYGALHAWLDDCLTVIANKVDEPEDDEDDDEDENRSDREKEHEDDDADQDEHDDEDEDEDEEDEQEHDDDEAEEAGGHKTQHYKKAQHRANESDAKNRSRHRKPHQETEMQFSNVGGRSLRARGSQPISYKDDLKAMEDDGEDDDEDEDAVVEEENDEDDGEERLGRGSRRRSKRTSFVKQTFGAARVAGARQTASVTVANNMSDVQSVHDSGTAAATVNGPFGFALPPPVLDGNQGAGSEDINIAQPVPTTTPAAPPRQGSFDRAVENVRERVDRAYDLVRDLTLMLLLVVTVNTFGLGSGIAMLILVWVYLSVAVFWASLMMLIENRIIDMVLGSIEMLLLLAMLIAAYAIGWTVID
ncbi:hypothetical protein EMPS_08885 [Entomortierella parvispora]|uniref:WHIM2 domain-containing protein n=1 Tax=Entomortierella parvispora TaxID=205924 RepID=A0A9P3LZI7_9FUNG|nr:hypothetical protein EMPS_08885 [Entomortierella parvispora]